MRKLMWFTIGFAVSCVAAVYLLAGSILGWLALAFGIAAIAMLFLPQKPVNVIAVMLIGFSVGVLWLWGYSSVYLQPAKQFDGKMIMTTIEATDYVRQSEYGGTVEGKILLGDRSYPARLYLDSSRDIKPGDKIIGVYTLGMTTPKGTEDSDYYQGNGIFVIADPEGAVSVEAVEKIPAKYFPQVLRKKITTLLDAAFPQDTLAFARALLLGDSSLLTYEQDTAFKVSGIRHVIAVSGLHVSILFTLIYTVAFRRRVSTALLGIPVLLLFAAVAGFTPSITRACIMQVLMILAILFDKDYDPPTALAFAVLVMLLANPMTITSVSFQLSVGCIIGIMLFSGRISGYILRKLGKPRGRSFWARTARWVSAGVGVTISAMIMTTPLLAYYFGMVSLVSVLTNLLVLWVVSTIFYGIMIVCVLGAVWLPLGKIVAWVISWLIRYVLVASDALASIPLAAVYTGSVYIVLWLAVCYVLFTAFMLCKKRSPVLLLGCMAACLCVSLAISYAEARQDDVCVTVFDVGEGQSILIKNHDEYYLIDCGGSSGDNAADVVSQTLLAQGVFNLDGLILTHFDSDHTGGVSGLLSRIGADKIYLPDVEDSGTMRRFLEDGYPDKLCWVNEDMVITNGNGVLSLISALPATKKENETSLCILFQAKDCDILITGDRGSSGEKALLAGYDLPKLDILVAGHHGSAQSTNFDLLSKTMPRTVVISCSDKYGHPAGELLQRLAMFGCEVRRTDLEGTIIFRG